MNRTVVIVATNLGRSLNGIAVYTLNLLRMISKTPTDFDFVIYLNRNGAEHVNKIQFPSNCRLCWVSKFVSPDYRFKGHLLRLLHANYLRLRHPSSVIFGTSQLEAIFWGGPQIITIHDTIPLLFRRQHKKQYHYFKRLLPYVLRRAKTVITPSFHSKEQLHKIYGLPDSKVKVIYHGVSTLPAKKLVRHNFIFYCGRLAPLKNLDGLLTAFSLLPQTLDYDLVIAGNGTREEIQKASSTRRVIVRQDVSDLEMAELFSRAALFVFPSFYEGFGLPPLEAMSFGCPVIASNAGSLPEICGDAAYYVDPHNPREIAHAIETVLSDAELRECLSIRAFERVSQYRWEDSIAAHLRVLKAAMEAPQSAPVLQAGLIARKK
jgi:glycosyltransferase involved in cell wall biosynthesis